MSTNRNDEPDSRTVPAQDEHQTPAAEADVQGYLIPWHPRIFASEPPPGTTDPYGPPMPGRDMPAHSSFFKPALA